MRSLSNLVASVAEKLFPPPVSDAGIETDTRPLRALVDEARREWQTALAYFETVTDPDLIDQAIFMIEAAEKRYMYLLRLVRESRAAGQIP
ncbi:MAG: YaaL family protein [Bacillota bacterium]